MTPTIPEEVVERDADTYDRPKHGWTCFFCGETFTTPGAARDHFGNDQLTDAACRIKVGEERGLVMALRKAEEQLARYRAEDSDADRAMYVMAADHQRALIRAEEEGYARGLRDALRQSASEAAEKATAAERKRCAEVVRNFGLLPPAGMPFQTAMSEMQACEAIATAIEKEPGNAD